MAKTPLISFVAALAAMLASAVGASAQSCFDRVAEVSGSSREHAMRSAYETVLRQQDPSMAQAWAARGLRIGEAPGYNVSKLASKCSAGGQGQICRIEATFCQ